MVTSDSRPEVEIQRFRACAMKNMQYNPYLWSNHRNFCIIKEIKVEEHDSDVSFKSRRENMTVSCRHSAFGHNYRTGLVTVDLDMGQIHGTSNVFLVSVSNFT